MSATINIIDSVYSMALFLILLPALWVAGKIILSQIPVLQGSQDESISPIRREVLILYWIVLAGLFILPLTDLLGLGYLLLGTFLPDVYNSEVTGMTTMWGSVSWSLYAGTQFLFTSLVYGFLLFHLRKIGQGIVLPYLGEIRMSKIQRIFLIFGIAGLANQLINTTVSRVIWLHVPFITGQISQGAVGITISWLLALLLLALVYLVINDRLSSKENEQSL
ncbi:MAG: hypothetical protein WBL25_16625 [Anaerolineales bacterium]